MIALQLENLSRSFGSGEGTVRALDDVGLAFERGSFTAVMGPSGSGKSTLLQAAAGIDRPSSGRVLLGDLDLGGLSERKLARLRRERLGFVFSVLQLLAALTAAQNVALPSRLAGRRLPRGTVRAALAAVGLEHRARTLDLRFSHGSLADVRGDRVAVSRVLAEAGDLRPGSRFTAAGRTLHVAAIYERAAGLGDVVTAHADAPTAAVFVAGSRRALDRFAARCEGLTVLTRDEYRAGLRTAGNEQAWAVWMIIGLATLFSALALVNTAAMATAERRTELATIRLLGGHPGLRVRTVALEALPTVVVALGAGAAIVATAVHGVPLGVTGIPLSVPLTLVAAVTAGAAALSLLAAPSSAPASPSAPPGTQTCASARFLKRTFRGLSP